MLPFKELIIFLQKMSPKPLLSSAVSLWGEARFAKMRVSASEGMPGPLSVIRMLCPAGDVGVGLLMTCI